MLIPAFNLKEYFVRFDELLIVLKPYRSFMLFGGLGCLCAALLALAFHEDTNRIVSGEHVTSVHTQRMTQEIQAMHQSLESMEKSRQTPESLKPTLETMEKNMEDLQGNLSSMKDDMDIQMSDLKKAVNSNPNMKQYLDAKELPFKVISIDVLDQQPFASVNDDDHISPMAVGDALAGWQLEKADYATATAEFKNAKDQYVKVVIQG